MFHLILMILDINRNSFRKESNSFVKFDIVHITYIFYIQTQ